MIDDHQIKWVRSSTRATQSAAITDGVETLIASTYRSGVAGSSLVGRSSYNTPLRTRLPPSPSPSSPTMDFFKSKQPIALPLDPEDEKLLKSNEELDPELAADPPQQQERGKRCRFTRCRKIRLVGHFLILGAFLHWVWRPTVKFYNGTFEMPEVQFSDFTDLDAMPSTVPADFLWVSLS